MLSYIHIPVFKRISIYIKWFRIRFNPLRTIARHITNMNLFLVDFHITSFLDCRFGLWVLIYLIHIFLWAFMSIYEHLWDILPSVSISNHNCDSKGPYYSSFNDQNVLGRLLPRTVSTLTQTNSIPDTYLTTW